MLQSIIECYPDEDFLKADGFDEAIIGLEQNDMRLIYSVKKCLDILMKDMTDIEASEYFEFNMAGAFVGDKTPIWCYDDFLP